MKKLLLPLMVAMACWAPVAKAQISFTGSGTGVQDFAATPTVAQGWASLSIAGGAGDFTASGPLDTAINTAVNAANVTVALTTSGTEPPTQNATARHNTTGLYLQTRPTGNAYLVLMATIRNDSGGDVSSVIVSYDWAQRNPIPVNESATCAGHRAFWSLTGAPGSWTLIPEFSNGFDNNSTAQALSATLALGTWSSGANLYIIWCDDNGPGSTTNPQEGAYTIDNFQVSPSIVTAISITSQPVAAMPNEGGSASFTVVADGVPKTYRWYREPADINVDAPIAGANGATYTLNNVHPSTNGTYFVTISNALGRVESAHVSLTVIPDGITPTVTRAILSNDLVSILVTFSEPVASTGAGEGAQDTLNYNLYITTPGDGPAISAVSFQAGSGQRSVVITLGGPAVAGTTYNLQVENVADNAEVANAIGTIVVPVLQTTVPFMDFVGHNWKFDFSAVAAPADWFTPAFNDGSWSNAPSPFDNVNGGRAVIPNSLLNVSYNMPLTNSAEGGGGFSVTNRIPTFYFRGTFNYPYNPAQSVLILRTVCDDGDVIYLNGQVAFRQRCPVANDPFDIYGGDTGNGNGNIEGPFVLPTTNVVMGANRIAVLHKQGSITSSDITFALELHALAQTPIAAAPTISIAPGAVTWTATGYVLQSATELNNDPNLTMWTDVNGGTATSPFDPATLPASPTGSYFFRLRP